MTTEQSRLCIVLIAVCLTLPSLAQIDYVDQPPSLDQEQFRDESFHFKDNIEKDQDEEAGEDEDEDEDGHLGDGAAHEEEEAEGHSHYLHPSQGAFWVNVLIAAACTCVGAFCSGMTVGLMSIEKMQLEVMSISGDGQEKKMARRILAVVHDHHLMLVTLLLANAIGLETLPIIIHSLMPAWAAILFSTIIVLIVAEIVPQAVCTGPKKMVIAYHAAPIIQAMIKFFWILAYPMGKALDRLLGAHKHQRIQHKDFANFLTGGSQNLKGTEKLLLTSILELRTERVTKIMVPVSRLYMLELNERLTPAKVSEIDKKDFSYILVFKGDDRANVVGVIKTKGFALKYLKAQAKGERFHTVEDIFEEKHDILSVYEDTNLLEMLMLFQAKSHRFAVVIGKKKKVDPSMQSIMYSKSDMVAKNNEGNIHGVVFLYSIFEEIAEYNQQVTDAIARGEAPASRSRPMEMQEIRQPLLE